METTNILFLAASPAGLRPLALDEELRRIKELLSQASIKNVLKLVDVLAARPDDWLKELNVQRFRTIHFSGHGTQGGALQHVGSDGVQAVSIQALKATLQALKGEICLIVLNACYSRQQAEMLTEEIDCVIAMNDTIPDGVAITFTNAFYRAFFSGQSVQNAFEQGKVALMLQGMLDEAQTPELLVRPGIDASTVTLIKPLGRKRAFIVCSRDREDRHFLDELHTHLAYYVQEGLIDYWDHTKLAPGSQWHQETMRALTFSDVAVLLISANFFSDPFITQEQLPALLQAEKDGKLQVLCVSLRPFTFAAARLGQFTWVNSQPLSGMNQSKREEVWSNIAELIQHNLQKDT